MITDYSFLAIDEGHQRISLVDLAQGGIVWTTDLAAYPLARDMQRLGPGRALVGYDGGCFEIDIATGVILAVCGGRTGVTAATRLADGRTLLAGHDLDGAGGVNVLTLGPEHQLLHTARRDGDYVRLMRTTPQGTYLLCMNDHILETTPRLDEVRRFAAPGFEHAWKAERLDDGATLVSAGYGAFMAVFNADGACVRRFGAGVGLPGGATPFFYATFEHTPRGTLLVAHWQGHGPEHGDKRGQLLEFDADGTLLDSWWAGGAISSLQGILLL